jgi:hypothetical protein
MFIEQTLSTTPPQQESLSSSKTFIALVLGAMLKHEIKSFYLKSDKIAGENE